ncbi:MAG: carbonic anhydrase, partial [Geminicoccaceae bacterium]
AHPRGRDRGLVVALGAAERPNAIPPEEALSRLMRGNQRYVANDPEVRDYSLAKVQYPIAAILGCADSRVAPELVFDQGPGDLFVVRNAGNVVADPGLASLEYAVEFLGVPLLFVLGHGSCGAVTATIQVMHDGIELPGHLPGLIEPIRQAVSAAEQSKPANLLTAAIEENVRLSVGQLASATPVLSEAVEAGRVKVIGGVCELATGAVRLV